MAETGLPDASGNPRQEGYLLACEGILRSRFGRRPSSVVARTLEILSREEASGARVRNAPRVSGVGAWLSRLLPWIQGRGRGPALAVGAIALGFALMAILLSSVRQSAPTELGRLISVVGEPLLSGVHGRSLAPVISNAPVHLGDHLETGDADKAEIRFLDGTTLRLGFNTRVEIGKQKTESRNIRSGFLGSPPPPLRPSEVYLLQGQVWTQVRKAAEDDPQSIPYAIRTDAATAIARGTEFGVKMQRPSDPSAPFAIRDSRFATVLTVKEGVVDFTNAHGTVRATAMTESTATAQSPPTEPRRLETLQVVTLARGGEWSLMSRPLDAPTAAQKLVGGGGWVGIELSDVPSGGPAAGTEVRVGRVWPSSPAARAGLQAGDVIATVDGRKVERAGWLEGMVLMRSGEAMKWQWRRGNGAEVGEVTLTPIAMPAHPHRPGAGPRSSGGRGRVGVALGRIGMGDADAPRAGATTGVGIGECHSGNGGGTGGGVQSVGRAV